MSLLTPLYVLGLAAISLPVLFHLIRRKPRGEMRFSSLMFLSPSPPRLTRRSRLENILLLVLRGAVLTLLALAFARPFLRQQVPLTASDTDQRRVAIVVDTSASMRRGDLWQQAEAAVGEVMDEARPFDQLAVFTCDESLRPLVSFEAMAEVSSRQRAPFVRERLSGIVPTWAATQLGQGLMDAVDIVSSFAESPGKQSRMARRIVLVSDLQAGSRINALADYPWPEDVDLELRELKLADNSNAGLHRLADRQPSASPADAAEVRVRVSNDAHSTATEFELQWLDDDRAVGQPTAAHVPPGESRVVRVRRPKSGASRLRLTGDSYDFDNVVYFASRAELERSVLYIGADESNDAQGLRYYLERALTDGLARPARLVAASSDEPLVVESPGEMPLVIVATEPTESQVDGLRQYAEGGGTLLFVLAARNPTAAWSSLVGLPPLEIEEAKVEGYTMLRQIAFDDPLFAPMAGPHFNDFTQIHFWNHRRLQPEQLRGANIIARFESGDAALAEWRLEKGRVLVLTSGWQPSDSQWARSWKFVLFVSALVESGRAGNSDQVYFLVNEPVPLGARENDTNETVETTGDSLRVIKPDGTQSIVAAEARAFTDTSQLGIYELSTGEGSETIAVNLDPQESRTTALGAETLEQLGARLVHSTSLAKNQQREEYLRDVALESRQKLWQWLVVGALGVLIAETWLAGRAAKPALTEGVTA